MTYYHAFWTKPMLKPGVAPDAQELFVWDFEALTWLLSALEIRRHSEIRLITDSRGRAFVRKAGFDWVYNGGVSTELDAIPPSLDSQIFWAAGKLFAHRAMEPPCACIDPDAVLWRPLRLVHPVMALHTEDRSWTWYKADESQFRRFGFDDARWDWTVDPVNAAVVAFRGSGTKEFYTDTAIGFMERYSREAGEREEATPMPDALLNDPMVFAEQRLLAMCAAQTGEAIGFLTQAYLPGVCVCRNPDCLHLWGSKTAYRMCHEARVALVKHLIQIISDRFPEAQKTVMEWKLDGAQPVDQGLPRMEDGAAAWHAGGLTFSLIRNVRGVVWVQDPNVDVRRRVTEGCRVWSGEVIQPEQGASFELVVAGRDAVEFCQV